MIDFFSLLTRVVFKFNLIFRPSYRVCDMIRILMIYKMRGMLISDAAISEWNYMTSAKAALYTYIFVVHVFVILVFNSLEVTWARNVFYLHILTLVSMEICIYVIMSTNKVAVMWMTAAAGELLFVTAEICSLQRKCWKEKVQSTIYLFPLT